MDDCAPSTNILVDVSPLVCSLKNSKTMPLHRWFVQPLDVLVFGLFHFTIGALFGSLLDNSIFGPMTDEERKDTAKVVGKTFGQMICVVLLFSYLRKWLLLLRPRYFVAKYDHSPVPEMDGGFAMSIGFAWTQRNLISRFDHLTKPNVQKAPIF